MQPDQPLVSVLMTAYNREKYISEAIESVLSSTFKNLELIIVDDGSVDNTVKLAREYGMKDSRVKVFTNEKNLGDYPNRNRAAGYARGKFLMYVDSDDSILPTGIEYVIQQFAKFQTAKFSSIYYHNDIIHPTVLEPKESIYKHFFKNWYLNTGPGATIILKDYFNSIGGFPEIYGPANDMYYNIKAASNSPILLLPFEYLNYRVHEGQEKNNKLAYLKSNYRYLNDVMQLPELPLSADQKSCLLKKHARQNIKSFIFHLKQGGNLMQIYKAFKMSGIRIKDLI